MDPAAVDVGEADVAVVHDFQGACLLVLIQLAQTHGGGKLGPIARIGSSHVVGITRRQLPIFEVGHHRERTVTRRVGGAHPWNVHQGVAVRRIGGHLAVCVHDGIIIVVEQPADDIAVDQLGGVHEGVILEVERLGLSVDVRDLHPSFGIDVGPFADAARRRHADELDGLDDRRGAGVLGEGHDGKGSGHGDGRGFELHSRLLARLADRTRNGRTLPLQDREATVSNCENYAARSPIPSRRRAEIRFLATTSSQSARGSHCHGVLLARPLGA